MTTRLETNRLTLRPWTEADAPALFRWARDPEVGPRAGWEPHASVEESAKIIHEVLDVPGSYAIVIREGEPEGESTPEAAERTEPEAAPSGGAQLWFEGSDGALAGFDGRRRLVALPSDGVAVPDWAEGVVRRINGREYVVFPR